MLIYLLSIASKTIDHSLCDMADNCIGSFISLAPFCFSMVSKQNIIAVVLILLGVGVTQIKPNESFAVGIGVGIVVMASLWIIVLIIRDLKKK